MSTKREALSLVGAVRFMAVEAGITKGQRPMCVLLRFLMFAVQSIKCLCADFWGSYLTQNDVDSVSPFLTSSGLR